MEERERGKKEKLVKVKKFRRHVKLTIRERDETLMLNNTKRKR